MTEVKNWTAARSGAAITVKGISSTGSAITVAGVKLITPSRERIGVCNAVTKDGDSYALLPR